MKLGLYNDSFKEYQAHPGISKSGLDQFRKSPLQYKYSLTAEREQTPAMLLGEAIHCAVLEPKRFESSYFNLPEGMRRGTKAYDELQKANEGKIALNHTEWGTTTGIVKSLSENKEAQSLLKDAEKEVSAYSLLTESLIIVKGRMDAINHTEHTIIDLKTTEDASRESFSSSILKYRYHVQAAIYVDLMKAITKKDFKFKIIAVQKDDPFDFSIHEVGPLSLDLGRSIYKQELIYFFSCLTRNEWPGLPKDSRVIEVPQYAFKKEFL